MIDFSKIKISKEKLGSFGDCQFKGEVNIGAAFNVSETKLRYFPVLEKDAEKEIKRELFNKIYGDLVGPFYELKNILEFVIRDMNYNKYPSYFNPAEIRENLEKLEKLLERPK